MPTDLTKVSDHPAEILYAEGAKASGANDHLLDTLIEVGDPTGEIHRGIRLAATTLRQYEADRGVTFAALDNDALAEVRRTYATLCEHPSERNHVQRSLDLANAVRDLLGLEDA